MEELTFNDRKTIMTSDIKDLRNFLEGRKSILITQRYISNLAKKFIAENLLISEFFDIEDGEEAKNLGTVMSIVDYLGKNNIGRYDCLISFGGGSASDVVGFTASIYKRGMELAIIPTTLLSMIDASIGGKNGIDIGGTKNQIGTFYQPGIVYSNVNFLKSLSEIEYKSGLGEIIKYGLSTDRNLLSFMINHIREIEARDEKVLKSIVTRSQKIKMGIVKKDERETEGIREVLNVGHTVGHAIESSSGFKIRHGIAVVYGMLAECELSVKFGLAEPSLCNTIREIIKKFNFPVLERFNINEIIKYITNDKKIKGGKINFPALKGIGETEIIRIDVRDFLREVKDEKIWLAR
jgi:3-dehydroquinate synthase